MPAFTITTPSTAITLDDAGRGAATFTVANQSGRALRARGAVTAIEPASPDWFAFEGDAERELPQDGSETYTIRVTVPAGAEKGPRSFRLDIASVDRPDEEWAHGPVVGFDLSVGAPMPPGYVETIIGALAGAAVGMVLVLVVGLLLWIVSGRPTDALSLGFLPALSGSFVAAAALGGAIGIFIALLLRAIPHPAPSDTSLAYVAAALVLGTALAIAPAAFAGEPALAIVAQPQQPVIVAQSVNPFIIAASFRITEPPLVIGPICCVVTFRPTPTPTRPPTAAPTAPPTTAPPTPPPTPQKSPVTPTLTLPLVLVASLLAAAVARAATRFRSMGHL